MFKGFARYNIRRNVSLRKIYLHNKKGYTTVSETHQQVRRKATFRDLVRAPILKSLFLTTVFGSAVVGLMENRRELETLEQTYNSKFNILQEIISKLENGQTVDINQELKLVNKLTKYKYNTITDIELDEQLDQFLKMAEDENVEIREPQETKIQEVQYDKSQIETTKFL